MSQMSILRALRDGPRTNAELQELITDHSGAIARDARQLVLLGKIRRIDGMKGRGTIARYALVTPHAG